MEKMHEVTKSEFFATVGPLDVDANAIIRCAPHGRPQAERHCYQRLSVLRGTHRRSVCRARARPPHRSEGRCGR